LTATIAEQGRGRAAAEEDRRADKPRVGDVRRQLSMRPPLPGRRADDRSSRGARAVVALLPREARPPVTAESGPNGLGGGRADTGPRKAATGEARRVLHAEAVALIRRHYAGDLRLTDVARRIGASPRALQRAFADHGERSFSAELRATRLNVAARLLRTTDLPVGEIARHVGYRDHAPFTKAFRRHHGTAPRAHRLSR
jgi:AraC-like DNA-binding protein